jgi:hypothetical protein
MPLIVTRTARSIIYLVCIGGLLVLNGLIVTVLWNKVFLDVIPGNMKLSFLEGVGITAFAYVIVLSIRSGIRSVPKGSHVSAIPDCAGDRHHVLEARLAHLSPEQRAKLKHDLVHHCGCKETQHNS